MTRTWLTGIVFLLCGLCATAQPKPAKKPANKNPSQADMNKMLEEAMKAEGMSAEEQAEMKKMMQGVMPAIMEAGEGKADYATFTSNKDLIPQKDAARIAKMRRKPLTQAEVSTYAGTLLAKIMAKAPASEVALIKKHSAAGKTANAVEAAAVEAMLQGHAEAALGLAMKAVQADPTNKNYQNNMAAMLTQYGHPDLAMPILTKLQGSDANNSTVMNNLAYAWLGLGVTDSAKLFAGSAARINPSQPDAKLCGGLMEELIGDPIKEYTESMEDAPNPVTEQIMNNKGVEADLNWDKIRRSIAIYEYFPPNWITTPPMMHNDVNFYDQDKATKDAWQQMGMDVEKHIQGMVDKYQAELDALTDKGEEAFATEMMNEALKGQSMMSKTAVSVLKVLFNYQLKMQEAYVEEYKQLMVVKRDLEKTASEKLSKLTDQMNKSKSDCSKFKVRMDEVENDFMKAWNTKIYSFQTRFLEQYRQWLNAWVTWNWYVAGSVKGTVVMGDLQHTQYFLEKIVAVVTEQEIRNEHCRAHRVDVTKNVELPTLPNFECPAVVSFPSGKEWQEVQAGSKNLDQNNLGIKNEGGAIPNVSVGYGVGNEIAQPGAHPFVKTADGSVTINQGSLASAIDRGLSAALARVNLKKQAEAAIDKRLTEQLKKINQQRGNEPEELAPLSVTKESMRNARIANELMKKMMSAPCAKKATAQKKPKFEVGFGELSFVDEQPFTVGVGTLSILSDDGMTWLAYGENGEIVSSYYSSPAIPGWSVQLDGETSISHYNANGDLVATSEASKPLAANSGAETSLKNTKTGNAGQQAVVNQLKATVQSIETNGLQPSISNSVQASGPFNFLQNLFK